MRSLLLAFFLICLSFSAFSQNDNALRKTSLKIYNLTTVERDYPPQYTDSLGDPNMSTYYNVQLLHPTIALQWYNASGNGHEIELTSFRMSTNETNQWSYYSRNPAIPSHPSMQHTSAIISLRYEFILFTKQEGEPKLVPALGFGINPYYMMDIYNSSISTVFPEQFQSFGARFFAIPRLNYSISERLYLDLNFPISIYDYRLVFAKDENPAIPINERTTTIFDSESFAPLFSARVGLGIRL